jgi:Tfp pilus assembly protein FimV
MQGFQPSSLSYGAINPEVITGIANLVSAGAGAGVAIGGAVAQRKAAKRAEAQARRQRRRQRETPALPTLTPPPSQPVSTTPSWVLPVALVALVGGVGVIIWKRRRG